MLFKILAIIILLLFYGYYFIKMFLQKRKGIQTDQIGKGKTGFVKFVEITMKIASFSVPIVEVSSIILLQPVSFHWLRWIGVAVGFIGVIIFFCSVVTMKDSWRAGISETDKTDLVTDGIYQISRNPAFLGFDMIYIGILCMFFNWILFAVSVFGILMFHLQIVNVEEEFLLKTFGDEYQMYKSRVNRYLGRRK